MTEQTKTITFEGQQYDVPVWVNWVARDMDGDVYGYESMPHTGVRSWHGAGEYTFLRTAGSSWDESLIFV